MTLSGKQAVVTGVASGIGAAVVAEFVGQGAGVIDADLNLEGLEAALQNEPNVRTAGLDVTWEADWAELFLGIERLDLFAVSAGITQAAPVAEITLADWRRVMAVNLDGAVLGVRHSLAREHCGAWIGFGN